MMSILRLLKTNITHFRASLLEIKMRRAEFITLAHGAGGKEMQELLSRLIFSKVKISRVGNGIGLESSDDSAIVPLFKERVVFSMDSYTVNPIFFPGGDIGKLAITGTVNDISVMGAQPIAIMDAIVVEEGFPLRDLDRIVRSMVITAENLGIALVGGDFKVMPKGSVDKIVVTTAGVGVLLVEKPIMDSGLKPGDKIVISGTIGEHGATIMALQSGLEIEAGSLRSDCTPIVKIMEIALKVGGVHAAKDPTRGGIAMALNEMARKSGVMIILDEKAIPIREEVRAYCEMLGVDPFVLACEGRVLLGVEGDRAEGLVEELHRAGYKDATIIGDVVKGKAGYVVMKTIVGGHRLVEPPIGEIVPRIC